jgi:hypothetical protein
MRRARILLAPIVLCAWAGVSGCTHNYYYGYPAGTAPGVLGEVCQVPTQTSGGTVIVQSPGQPTYVAAAPANAPVLVSEPLIGGGPLLRAGSRFTWRRPDPESLATTRIDGAIDDSTVTR